MRKNRCKLRRQSHPNCPHILSMSTWSITKFIMHPFTEKLLFPTAQLAINSPIFSRQYSHFNHSSNCVIPSWIAKQIVKEEIVQFIDAQIQKQLQKTDIFYHTLLRRVIPPLCPIMYTSHLFDWCMKTECRNSSSSLPNMFHGCILLIYDYTYVLLIHIGK